MVPETEYFRKGACQRIKRIRNAEDIRRKYCLKKITKVKALSNSPNGYNGSSDETLCSGEDSRRAEQNERDSHTNHINQAYYILKYNIHI